MYVPRAGRCARVQSIAFPPLGRAVDTATPPRSRAVQRRSVQGGRLTRGAQKSGGGAVVGARAWRLRFGAGRRRPGGPSGEGWRGDEGQRREGSASAEWKGTSGDSPRRDDERTSTQPLIVFFTRVSA